MDRSPVLLARSLLGAALLFLLEDPRSAGTVRSPGASGDGPSPSRQENSRLTLQELLARMKKMRDDRVGELRGSVEQILRTLELEAQTHRSAGLVEQKDRLVALGAECAPILVESIDPGESPDDTARLREGTITQALVEQRSPVVTARLVEIARTGPPEGRLNAAKALTASPDADRASAILVELFRSAQGDLRPGALVILYLSGERSARKELLADYDEQIDKNKQWAASFEARANVLYRIGEYREATRDYQKSLMLAASDVRAHTEGSYMGLARCYMQRGKLKEASGELEKAPLSKKQLGELAKEPVFKKLVDHPKYGAIFRSAE